MHSWTTLCSELVVKTWFAQRWVCCLYLTDGRSSTCHERQIHNEQDKDCFELWRKYIVISLCKGTIKSCTEFKAKRTRGTNNMIWMLFHHSASLIVSCFTLCLLEMLLAVKELPLKRFYHHIPFKCLELVLLPWCSLLFDTKDSKLFCETVACLPFSEWPLTWCQWLFQCPFTRALHGIYGALFCHLIQKTLW